MKKTRFKLLKDDEKRIVSVLDVATGLTTTPSCGDDLSAFAAYLSNKGLCPQVQEILGDVAIGGKPITNMMVAFQDATRYKRLIG